MPSLGPILTDWNSKLSDCAKMTSKRGFFFKTLLPNCSHMCFENLVLNDVECIFVCRGVHMGTGDQGSQRRALGHLELQAVVSYLM